MDSPREENKDKEQEDLVLSLRKSLSRVEKKFSSNIQEKGGFFQKDEALNDGILYVRTATKLFSLLSSDEVLELKLAARTWKLIIIPLTKDGSNSILMKDLLYECLAFFKEADEKLLQLKAFKVSFKILKENDLLFAEFSKFFNQKVLTIIPEAWDLAREVCASTGNRLYLLRWFTYWNPSIPDISWDIRQFEEKLISLIISGDTNNLDDSDIGNLFLQKLKSSPPQVVSEIIESTCVSLFFICRPLINEKKNAIQVFILLTNVLQRYSILKPIQVLPWIFMLLASLQANDCHLNEIEISTWNWICLNLNKILATCLKENRKECDLSRIGPDFNFSDRPELILDKCRLFCSSSPLQEMIAFRDRCFLLGPKIVIPTETVIPLILEEQKTTPKAIVQTSLEGIQSEIAALKLQKESLTVKSTKEKLDISNHIFIFDTNVLMDYADSLYDSLKIHPLRIAIPFLVLEELLGLAKGEKRDNALHALNCIEKWRYGIFMGSKLYGLTVNGDLKADLDPKREVFPTLFNVRCVDDAIVFASSKLHNGILVSDDINMSLKAAAHKVPVMTSESFFHIINDHGKE